MVFEWDYYEKWAEIRNKLESLGIKEKYKIYILESLEEYRIKDMYDMLNNRDVLASANGFIIFSYENHVHFIRNNEDSFLSSRLITLLKEEECLTLFLELFILFVIFMKNAI